MAALVSLTTPLVHREESPRRVKLVLLRVKEENEKLTLFSVAVTSHEAAKNSMKMKKTTMDMHVQESTRNQ